MSVFFKALPHQVVFSEIHSSGLYVLEFICCREDDCRPEWWQIKHDQMPPCFPANTPGVVCGSSFPPVPGSSRRSQFLQSSSAGLKGRLAVLLLSFNSRGPLNCKESQSFSRNCAEINTPKLTRFQIRSPHEGVSCTRSKNTSYTRNK